MKLCRSPLTPTGAAYTIRAAKAVGVGGGGCQSAVMAVAGAGWPGEAR